MWGGFDLSSIVEAGTKLKEEVESNITGWDQTGQPTGDGSDPRPEPSDAAGAHDAPAAGTLLDSFIRGAAVSSGEELINKLREGS
jgi:hypothetical protein